MCEGVCTYVRACVRVSVRLSVSGECKHNLLPDSCFYVNLLGISQIDNTTENNVFKCVCVCVCVYV